MTPTPFALRPLHSRLASKSYAASPIRTDSARLASSSDCVAMHVGGVHFSPDRAAMVRSEMLRPGPWSPRMKQRLGQGTCRGVQ